MQTRIHQRGCHENEFYLDIYDWKSRWKIWGHLSHFYVSGMKKATRQMTHFFICFSCPNCQGNSFLRLKIVKICFHEISPLVHFSLQIAWISEVKAVRSEFCPIRFTKHTHWGKYKTRFYFFCRIENKSQNFQGNLMV